MKVLALAVNHDTGIVAYNGQCCFSFEQLYAVNEERLIRKKATRRFPYKSVRSCGLGKPDRVIVAGMYTPIFVFRLLNAVYHRFRHENSFSYQIPLYVMYHQLAAKSRFLRRIETGFSRIFYSAKLGIHPKKIAFYDHHKCHAASAYFGSGHSRALVVTLDMMGDAVSTTVSIGSGRYLRNVYSQSAMNGIGLFYAKITQILGFRPSRHEGKVTGLAAYGSVNQDLLGMMRKVFVFEKPGFSRLNLLREFDRSHALFRNMSRFPAPVIAATAQHHMEQEVGKYVRHWLRETGECNLCLAGGIFANVKLNQHLHELEEVHNIYVFPHMGDGGLAFGAMMLRIRPQSRLDNTYLGPGFADADIRRALDSKQITYQMPQSMPKAVADLLARGKTVAYFHGRMEFGPRALGSRSILCEATNPEINALLNKRLKRTEFMPFAPLVLERHLEKCFHGTRGAEHAARFMTITFKCKDFLAARCPGVVHVDGTARPQVITKKDNMQYFRILEEYYRLTGNPAIINTSFNMHEEPIVCTPDDAVRAFLSSRLDHMAIGGYLV